MTSEEWLIAFGVVPDQKTIDSLDAALKEQRETDIKALRNVCQHFMGHSFNTGSVVLLEDAIRNARVEKSDDK